MNRKILPILLTVFLFAFSSFAQNPTGNLLENTNLHFFLLGDPAPQDVGFDNPKSSWKVKYELYLTDFSEMKKLGLSRSDNNREFLLPITRNKSYNQRIKKKSTKISQGIFTKKLLSNESNRQAVIRINLPPDVIEIFNQATKIPERNPTFVLFVTEKVSVKNSAQAKLKEKYLITGFRPLKHAASNQTFDYWDVRNISFTTRIVKQENGQLKLFGGMIH
ncbi:MAG TPA: hypothetical protein VF599_05430 [Pyrinomonadaceae bacterium]|jgi:hypothetical protein